MLDKVDEFKRETQAKIKEKDRKEFEDEIDTLKTNMQFVVEDAQACNYRRMVEFTDPYQRTKERLRKISGVNMLDFANKVEPKFLKLIQKNLIEKCKCKKPLWE